jgi:protein MAK11
LYDLSQVFGATEKAEENTIEAVGRYDTKGSRLTCCFLADGRRERVVEGQVSNGSGAVNAEEAADVEDAADEDDDEDMYDSAQEEGEEEEGEEEEEEEEEGEYE